MQLVYALLRTFWIHEIRVRLLTRIRRLTLTSFRSYRAAQIEVCAHRVVQNGRSHVGLRDEGRLAAPLCCFADQRSALAIA